jgi:hypothetical protein
MHTPQGLASIHAREACPVPVSSTGQDVIRERASSVWALTISSNEICSSGQKHRVACQDG